MSDVYSNEKRKSKVLVIDDETANIIALTNILSPEYDILASKNGRDAITLAHEHMPEVIMLDVLMPDMDGYEVITELKKSEKTQHIPVIFITGLDNIEAEKKGLALGAADYIPKPFHTDIVKLRVKIQIKLVNHIRTLEERDEMERQLKVIKDLEAGLIEAKEDAETHRELAEHSSRAKSEFLSRMSHEMLTPMNTVIGMLQVIKIKGVPENIKSCINQINSASTHLLEMINDVLDVTGMEYGVFKLGEATFDVKSTIRGILETVEYNADQKKQTLTTMIDPSIPSYLLGDEKRLKQVISNLLANAVKFTPDNGEIYFSAKCAEEKNDSVVLRFEVKDNGIGISEDQQKALFTMFEQVDGGLTRKHSGIGIGLALSKRIIEMMGGEIWIESELDKGAKFSFTGTFRKLI